jgi:hypothetical protein
VLANLQVISWLGAEGLEILGEDFGPEDGWGYHHFLLVRHRRVRPAQARWPWPRLHKSVT